MLFLRINLLLLVFIGISGCVGKDQGLRYDPSIVPDNKNGFIKIPPPPYNSIFTTYVEPPHDYVKNNKKIDKGILSKLDVDIERYQGYMQRQKKKTKIGAWSLFPFLSSVNSAYLLTNDEKYLDIISDCYAYFLKVRMDNRRRVRFDGQLLPQWERLDRYNILSVSPYKSYTEYNEKAIMKERKWFSMFFSDINYNGLILDQFLRFSQIVERYNLSKYKEISKSIIDESVKTVDSHESDWIILSEDKGYYIFPSQSPFYLDGVEIPINEAAPFGTSLIRLAELTGNAFFADRARAMWNHWVDNFARDEYGYLIYPYVTGKWREGWSSKKSPSVNTPESPAVKGPDVFHKAGLTIKFMIMIDRYFDGIAEDYLVDLKKIMLAVKKTSNKSVVSEFPNYLGFWYPIDSVHARTGYYGGWIGLLNNEPFLQSELQLAWKTGGIKEDNLLMGLLLEEDHPQVILKSEIFIISPTLISDESKSCDILFDKDAVANVTFQHTSPKHNTLYLFLNKNLNSKIRLKINKKRNCFEGRFFIPANQCIQLSWNPITKFAYPVSEVENKVSIEATFIAPVH